MRCHFSWSIVLVGVALVLGVRAQAGETKPVTGSDHPLWQVDLRQVGYERFFRKGTRPLALVVDFTDIDHVAVGWISPDVAAVDGRKAPPGPEPSHLNVVVFDARTGQSQSKADWPTSARYFSKPFFFGIPDGKLLICSDNVLRLLSPGLEVVREQELPNHARCLDVGSQLSPSRSTLLISILAEHARQTELLDVETFAILSRWTEERAAIAASRGIRSISDHWLAGYCGEPTEVCVRRFDEELRPLHLIGFDTQMDKRQRIPLSFVSDEILAVSRSVTDIATVSGTVLFQIKPPGKRLVLPSATSAGGERFAAFEDRYRGIRSEPLDMYPFLANDRALVYSIKDRCSVFSTKLRGTSPWTPWDVHDNFLALSPDGMSLAVLSDGVLKIYALPSDSREQPELKALRHTKPGQR